MMRTCKDCRIVLEDKVRYCPKCGKGVADESIDESTPHVASKQDASRLTHKAIARWTIIGLVALVVVLSFTYLMLSRDGKREYVRPARTSVSKPAPSQRITNPVNDTKTSKPITQPLAGGSDVAPTGTALRTPAELSIKNAVSQSDIVASAGAHVDDVIADPRQAVATVTFSISGANVLTKENVLKATLGIVRSAFAANAQIKFVTVRCLTGSGASTQMIFIGDIARSTLESLPENNVFDQMDSAFTNMWWNSQVR